MGPEGSEKGPVLRSATLKLSLSSFSNTRKYSPQAMGEILHYRLKMKELDGSVMGQVGPNADPSGPMLSSELVASLSRPSRQVVAHQHRCWLSSSLYASSCL